MFSHHMLPFLLTRCRQRQADGWLRHALPCSSGSGSRGRRTHGGADLNILVVHELQAGRLFEAYSLKPNNVTERLEAQDLEAAYKGKTQRGNDPG